MDSGDDGARTKLDSPRWNRPTVDAGASAAPTPRPGAFDKLKNRYALGGELGRGGMGRVVAATDTALDRPVAIKQALSDNPELLARFEREARITAKLGHPAIVPVFDSGRDDDGHPYYVMRQIDGVPLAERVKQGERMALIPNVLAAVDATAFAHAQRIIHRDIKPWNILVGHYGETLLIDWGLARELDDDRAEAPIEDQSSLTRAGRAYGTPGFMAPEQARGELVDARADVFALGATLAFVLAGDIELRGKETAWIAQAAKGELAPAALPDEVPRELVAIVHKAMAMRADDRYADAGALAADLRRFLAGQLVAAHAYTARERVSRFVRRHKVAVVASIIVVGVAAYATANVISERADARTARALAEAEGAEATDRADEIIIDRAQRYAASEPARAVVALRELAPSSKRWREARAIASAAAQSGIASGSRDHAGAIRTVAFAADGHRVLTTAADGALRVRDLATGSSRELWRDTEALGLALWTDERTIVVGAHDRLVAIDAETGANRVLATTGTQAWPWLVGKALRYQDAIAHTLEQVALDGTRTQLATDAYIVARAGDATVIAGQHDVRLLAGDKLTPLAHADASAVAGSPDRVAAVVGREVIEWSTADGRELRRLALEPRAVVLQLAYGPRGLMIETARSTRRALLDATGNAWFEGTFTGLWFADNGAQAVVLGDDGVVRMIGEGIVEELPSGRTDLRVVGASRDWVVAGSIEGALYWWPLRDRLPIELHPTSAIAPCVVSGGRVVGAEGDTLFLAELSTGVARELAHDPMIGCVPPAVGGSVLVQSVAGVRALDIASGKLSALPANDAWVIDEPREAVTYLRGREIHELRAGADAVVATLPSDAKSIVARSGVRYAVLADDTILRLDTGARAKIAAPLHWMDVDAAGALWLSSDRTLYRWSGSGSIATVAGLPDAIVQLAAYADAGVTAQLKNNALWVMTPDGHAVERLGGAWAKFVRLTQRVAIAVHVDGTLIVDLDTGLTTLHPGRAFAAAISGDGRQVAIGTADSPPSLRVYTDRVPSEPAPLRAWLAKATNATLAPGTDALQWPAP